MTEPQKQAVEILNQVSDAKLDPEEAVKQLVELGSVKEIAQQMVFFAQGGDDVVIEEVEES